MQCFVSFTFIFLSNIFSSFGKSWFRGHSQFLTKKQTLVLLRVTRKIFDASISLEKVALSLSFFLSCFFNFPLNRSVLTGFTLVRFWRRFGVLGGSLVISWELLSFKCYLIFVISALPIFFFRWAKVRT